LYHHQKYEVLLALHTIERIRKKIGPRLICEKQSHNVHLTFRNEQDKDEQYGFVFHKSNEDRSFFEFSRLYGGPTRLHISGDDTIYFRNLRLVFGQNRFIILDSEQHSEQHTTMRRLVNFFNVEQHTPMRRLVNFFNVEQHTPIRRLVNFFNVEPYTHVDIEVFNNGSFIPLDGLMITPLNEKNNKILVEYFKRI
jgi:hypothetical protein